MCEQGHYFGKVSKTYDAFPNDYNNSLSAWVISFSSRNIVVEKETLAFGVIEIIGSVGGTLGLFVGFSFYGIF